MINRKSAKIIQEKSYVAYISPEKKSLEQQMKEMNGEF